MSDNNLQEQFVAKEEVKRQDEEEDYVQDYGRASYVPNINFEMNQKTLTSKDINPKDLRAKVEEYLEMDGLTRDQLKLLLKQGAEDNYLFMIKEETYDKLADALGMKLDHADDNNVGNITGLLATARLEYADGMSKSPNIRNLDSTASRFAQLMKSKVLLKDKSEVGGQQNAAGVQKDLTFTQKSRAENQAINETHDDEESEPLRREPPPPVGSAASAQETSPYLMERVPRMTNQTLKNNLIIAGLVALSIVCFITWAIVTYVTRRRVVTDIIGFPLLISRGCALAIMILSIILLLLVSYDFMTCIRPY